ncbi:hypothetical protein Cpir12675_006318, partial [Ceratocystis pirilliformis]
PGISHDIQPSKTAELENAQVGAITTDVSDPQYLEAHGYVTWNAGNENYLVFSQVFGGPGLRTMLKISVNMEHKAVTIIENHLYREISRKERLGLPQIFQGLCHQQKIQCSEMKSIAMDIDDSFTYLDVETYRKINGLGSEQQIEIAANQPGWGIFSGAINYKYATEMFPGLEPESVIIKQDRRPSEDPKYTVVITEVIMVLFKQPGLKDEDAVVSPIDAHAAELSARTI